MKGKLVLIAAAIAASTALVAVPLTAASSIDTKLQIGSSLHFPAPGSSAGTWVASGAVNDSGTVSSQATLTQLGDQDDGRLEGTAVFVGQQGTFTIEFSGIGGPLTSPHRAARGTFEIVSGTGAYAETHGHGTFLIIIDFTTGQSVRTDIGEIN